VVDRDWRRRLVQAHHPNWVRAPEPSPGRACEDRARAAWTWNAFRPMAGGGGNPTG